MIRIPEGNAFSLVFPLVTRRYADGHAFDVPFDAGELDAVQVSVTSGGAAVEPVSWSTSSGQMVIVFPGDLPRGSYGVCFSGVHEGAEVRANHIRAFRIVPCCEQSNWEQFAPGSPLAMQAGYCVCGVLNTGNAQDVPERVIEEITEDDINSLF